jgi:hypothetical protein
MKRMVKSDVSLRRSESAYLQRSAKGFPPLFPTKMQKEHFFPSPKTLRRFLV